MVERKPEGALTKDEKRIVKALLNDGWRNQDIQALVNVGRGATINSAALNFKTEIFSVLSNIAWTYLLHEHYSRKQIKIVQNDGRTLLLGQMLERQDCPLSEGVRSNLRAMKTIRDSVEHQVLGKADIKWFGLFQACCLNFDKALRDLFGERLTLANDLAFALQFTRMNVE